MSQNSNTSLDSLRTRSQITNPVDSKKQILIKTKINEMKIEITKGN